MGPVCQDGNLRCMYGERELAKFPGSMFQGLHFPRDSKSSWRMCRFDPSRFQPQQ